ncbi:tenascin [Polymixia lowei]
MTNKDKLTASVNQTTGIKSRKIGDVKTVKDKPVLTVVQTVLSTSTKSAPASSATASKHRVTASVNQTAVVKSPTTSSVKTTKDKPSPVQPIKVVISEGCDSSHTKEQELKPGSPLVMTHKISLMPGGCTGTCVSEMAALKGRVARLEKEMSSIKDKCPCSANCPNDCSGNGKCEQGKCVCLQGFLGSDCSKCAPGVDCYDRSAKRKVKINVETVTLQVTPGSNTIKENTQGKSTKAEQTLFQKKDQKKGTESKDIDTKPKVATNVKVGLVKTLAKQGASVSKTTIKGSVSATKTSRPTVGQVLLKHEGRKREEARKGKTAVLTPKEFPKTDLKLVIVKEGAQTNANTKSGQLKDQPQVNVTQSTVKKSNGTAKVLTILTKVMETSNNKTRTGKETMEQSTLSEKNVTQSSGNKLIRKVKIESANATKVVQSDAVKTSSGKGKVIQKSQYLVNRTADEAKVLQNKTVVQSSGNTTRRAGGAGLGSVKVENITSYSFTLTWSAPQGMFKNFSVIRREHRAEGEEEEDEEVEEGAVEGDDKAATPKNTTEVQVQSENTDETDFSTKVPGSRSKAEGKRVSMVLPGSVRSVEFSNLRSQTRYALQIFGTAPGKRSKIHRVTVTTGPEPATELVFSNVTESSLTVSWSKPKSTFTGFRVTYTHSITGESNFVTVDSQQSSVVLSKLSAGSSYTISITTTQGKVQSDALSSIITTVPAPPTHLQAVNITDTRAVLQWTPSLGKVDRFIISYESSKTPNVTVTVMMSGNSVEHQLRGLQRGTLYTVKALSQKDSLQSTAVTTMFTTANVVKASEVSARSAVIVWKASTVVFHSYRLIYQVVGEETKEVILDSTVTEYKLTGLLSMTKYIVLVQGERDGQYTSVVATEFITGKLRFPFPTECSQELLNGALQSGEVDIYPQGKEGGAVRVYCDMETDGGGWTVFQRRLNGKTDFYRTWSDYSIGFGNLSEEFWLGNELLHNLTSMGPVSLRVDMHLGNDTAYAHYSNFSIDTEEKHYTITLSGYTGTAGDSMKYHNGRPFSTRDKDPDPLGIHCSRAYLGGWWYKNCYKTNLNGLYGINTNNQGVVWIDWKGKDSSISFTEMKFRPSGFSPTTHG